MENIYLPKSSGELANRRVPVAHPDDTIAQIESLFLEKARDFDSLDYIYVVDPEERLIGAISTKELFQQDKSSLARTIMNRKILSVAPDAHRERAVYLSLQHNLKAIPVVGPDGRFHGVVPNDTILYILWKESQEDLLKLGGVHHGKAGALVDNVIDLPVMKSLKHRLPWLILGLLGGMLAANIIGSFEETLNRNIVLAAFIPLIVYMADAVGTQMEAFFIRDSAVNPDMDYKKYFLKHLYVTAAIALILSIFLAVSALVAQKDAALAFVLGIALFSAIISSVFTGLLIPYAFSKLRYDPANSSGPIATIIQDLLSVSIYFSVASILMN